MLSHLPSSLKPPARRGTVALLALGAVLLASGGWFARGWIDRTEPAPIQRAAQEEAPISPPVQVVPAAIVEEEPKVETAPRRKRTEPLRVEPKPVPPPPAPAPPPPPIDLREEVNRLSRAAVALTKQVPEVDREQVKALASRINRLQSLPSLDGQEDVVRALAQELATLSRRR